MHGKKINYITTENFFFFFKAVIISSFSFFSFSVIIRPGITMII